jgi:hypothetical protein
LFRLLAFGLFTLLAANLSAETPKHNPSGMQRLWQSKQGQQMLRQVGHQEAEEARRLAAIEEQQRQRALAAKDQLRRQTFEAQLRLSPRLVTARVLEIARWASSGFQTSFTCDLRFNCVQWQSLSLQQAKATTMDITLPTPTTNPNKPAILLGGLSANRKLR